jgi:hypothetical protein
LCRVLHILTTFDALYNIGVEIRSKMAIAAVPKKVAVRTVDIVGTGVVFDGRELEPKTGAGCVGHLYPQIP